MIEGKSTAAWETQTSDPFINPAANAAGMKKAPETVAPAGTPDASAPAVPQAVPADAPASEKAVGTVPASAPAEQAK